MCAALGALAGASVGLAPAAMASDTQSKEWYLTAMHADEMWKYSTGKGVKVAVIDGGVNPSTPSLKGQVLVDEVPKAASYGATVDVDGHGTSMAEVIAGTGAGGGIKGLAPGAKIIPIRVQSDEMKDSEQLKSATSAQAIRAAADTDAKIINMSYGSEYFDLDEEKALEYAASKGKLLFASAGNEATTGNKASYPAADPHAIGVASIDKTGTVAKYSTHGNYVDLAAPGENVPGWCDTTFTRYCNKQGTSPASAIASASAALIWSAHPDWTADQVLRTLIDTAGRDWPKKTPSNYLGYGVVRPRLVLSNKKIDPGPADEDPLAVENGVDTDSNAATPSLSAAPPSSAKGESKGSGNATGPTSAAQETGSGGSTQTWVIIGAAAAVLVIGGLGFAVLRSRRNT
ncbi:S8 family serine peptidase [Streptomyces murinus]|uniref:S8 family serine peptidase n=1 Tax=Streptomyces murinus TaxID=33900 RepID=UPI0015FED743|nr:S8 family serine peptidase [Streptomyces murinus]WSI90205.1 S8 family serine peptidase [Streptomyces murinus]